MLGNNQRMSFLSIKENKIAHRPGREQSTQFYNFVEGQLKEIRRRDAVINGSASKQYEFIIIDGEDTYDLSTSITASTGRHIINALATIQNFAGVRIRISPYQSKKNPEYTNVSVYANGEKLDWLIKPEDLPKVNLVKVGRNEVKDDEALVAKFEELVDLINERLRATGTARAAAPDNPAAQQYEEEPVPDDMPEL